MSWALMRKQSTDNAEIYVSQIGQHFFYACAFDLSDPSQKSAYTQFKVAHADVQEKIIEESPVSEAQERRKIFTQTRESLRKAGVNISDNDLGPLKFRDPS